MDNNEIEVILVDATESPIERPKRNYKQKKFTVERRKDKQNKSLQPQVQTAEGMILGKRPLP